jgi:hypothetical protein
MKKILFIGPEVTDFLNPLAEQLKSLGYTLGLLENRKSPRNDINRIKYYDEVIDYQKLSGHKISVGGVLKYLFKKEFYKRIFNNLFLDRLDGKRSIYRSIRSAIHTQHFKEVFAPLLNKYDIISLHSITSATLSFVNYLDRDKKLIISYWGSDLFRIWGFETDETDENKNFFESFEAVKKADTITVISYEMERALIAKFGPEIKHKIVRTFFSTNDKQFDIMDKFKSKESFPDFLNKFAIPEKKIKITIGYCGDPICNHIPILNELVKLEAPEKNRIHLLVPMTYGNYTEEYKQNVINKLNQSEISYTLFDKYLTLDEVVILRLTSDIMIQMSMSDALSSSVCEAIYAGNILISAIWLPYSPFRMSDVYFFETDFSGLTQTVETAIKNFEQIKPKLSANAERVRDLTSINKTVEKWKVILESR